MLYGLEGFLEGCDRGVLVFAVTGDGQDVAALDLEAHDREDALEVGVLAFFCHCGFAGKAVCGFVDHAGGAGVRPYAGNAKGTSPFGIPFAACGRDGGTV